MRTYHSVAISLALLFLFFIGTVCALDVRVGVSQGQLFEYSYSATWTSTDPTATPPGELSEFNNIEKIQIKIKGVSGSTLSVDEIRLFKNGTQRVASGTINLETSICTIPYGFLIVGANLEKGQTIYPTGGLTISDTITRSYPSGQRETNLIDGQDHEQRTTIYFDKKTGVAVEYSYEYYETSNGYGVIGTETLLSTNSDIWLVSTPSPTSPSTTSPTQSSATKTPINNPTSNPGYSIINGTILPIILVIILIVIIVSVLVFRRKMKKRTLSVDQEFEKFIKK